MQIRTDTLPWPLDNKLRHILQDELNRVALPQEAGGILTFRDPDWTPEAGGYHTVEVAVDDDGSILYITDFAYYGRPPRCEIGKELDFDFSMGLFQHFGMEHPIRQGMELFRLWESNFISYYEMEAYTVSVSPMG